VTGGLLLQTPDPLLGESILGYVLRVSEENRYDTPWHIFRHAGYKQGEMITSGFTVQKLAAILGKDPDRLAKIAYLGKAKDGRSEYRLNGHSIGRGLNLVPLRLKDPAICPTCVKEQGIVDVCWDTTAFVACPLHGTKLLQRCPACNSGLTWLRPGLLTCSCGASLADAVSEPASAATLGLMSVLRSMILDTPLPPAADVPGALPLKHLLALPLYSLLRAIAILGRLSSAAGDSFGCVHAAADVFAEWPQGFHNYLRQMASDGVASGVQTAGLRKRFSKLYQALFKASAKVVGVEFLRDEFVRFGLEEWGEGVVDTKLLRKTPVKARFVSGAALASRVGVRPITVRRWIDQGTIPAKTIDVGSSKHYVADTAAVDQVPREDEDRLEARKAGKLADLPVSVLQELKRSGHYSKNPTVNCRMGFWPVDLKALNDRLVAKASAAHRSEETGRSEDEPVIALGRILGYCKLGGVRVKGSFVAEVLDGKIVPIRAPSDAAKDLTFHVSDVEAFRVRFAVESNKGTISAAAAAKLLKTGVHVVSALVAAGYVIRDPGRRTGVRRDTVEGFLKDWLPLSVLASEIGTSTKTMLARAKVCGVSILRLPSNPGLETPFIATVDVQTLRNEFSLADTTVGV
jgi:hypothetical protein